MKKLKVNATDLSSNGTVRRKVPKSTLYAKHEVDQAAGLVGKRYATRTAGSTRQYGMANGYDHLSPEDFMFGNELDNQPVGGVRVLDALSDKCIGYAKFADAMAYRIAAMRKGVMLEVYNDVDYS